MSNGLIFIAVLLGCEYQVNSCRCLNFSVRREGVIEAASTKEDSNVFQGESLVVGGSTRVLPRSQAEKERDAHHVRHRLAFRGGTLLMGEN